MLEGSDDDDISADDSMSANKRANNLRALSARARAVS